MPFSDRNAQTGDTIMWNTVTGGTASTAISSIYISNSTSNVVMAVDPESVDNSPQEATEEDSATTMSLRSNSEYTTKKKNTVFSNSGRRVYSADLVFSFVKSKLTKLEQREIKARLKNLQLVIQSCGETGQTALADIMLIEQATAIRQQEVAAAGFDTFVKVEDVNKFRNQSKTQIDFDPLEKFPRPIPLRVRNTISAVRKKELFDELMVLYHNPSREQIKSTKEKVLTKDPIVFGRFSYDPDVLYFIVDWIDEVCDLTMEQFVKTLKTADPAFETQHVAPISKRDAEAIKERAMEKSKLLNRTHSGNFRELAAVESLEHANFSWKMVRTLFKALRKSFTNSRKKTGFTIGGR